MSPKGSIEETVFGPSNKIQLTAVRESISETLQWQVGRGRNRRVLDRTQISDPS